MRKANDQAELLLNRTTRVHNLGFEVLITKVETIQAKLDGLSKSQMCAELSAIKSVTLESFGVSARQ